MKPRTSKPRQNELLEEARDTLQNLRNREKCLRAAIAEGICGLTPDATLDEAEKLLRRAARERWPDIHYDWAPKGCACFDAKDGTTYIFPI